MFPVTIYYFPLLKNRGLPHESEKKKEVMLTAYDYQTARYAVEAGVDILLVGDSLGTNVLGYSSVHDVTLSDMLHHTRAVKRGAGTAIVVSDLPYTSMKTPEKCRDHAQSLLENGADMVKIEVETGRAPYLDLLNREKIPFCGHIGFTPQTPGLSVSLQGKTARRATELLSLAKHIEHAGAKYLILELIPYNIAAHITSSVQTPTIGIGAGPYCNGEVQVWYDICGISEKTYRHTQVFAPVGREIRTAFTEYVHAVQHDRFPTIKNAGVAPEETLLTLTGEIHP
ncbi:3-methyl-2-oxobutanoate hydroxymethyltransferase [Chitinivibrio alkaliphilus ACht1]|uniref:3-methyl-2-oxobutanoate hydroxymethyltransferase n=1 Tax=Chitinivibrio alkaliphilus ACht1 TaxID=1313304 RepID=U7D9U3_9BACT|nr:3-methyl-2-oxobutanoate hydroxymethyltransferase [Chitinivibrio alkaliphilus ACht1]